MPAKAALVTGAGRRLGKALALALAKAGMDVLIHRHRSDREARKTAEEVRALGRRAWVLRADLRDPAQARALFVRARKAAGRVSLLVNSASIYKESRLRDFRPEELLESVRVHALAPLLLARALAEQKGSGLCVVNLLDCRIADYDFRHAAYHLGKRMLFSLTRMMALEYAPRVRVNAVAPGLILPPEGEDAAWLERLSHTTPLGTHGGPEDVVEAVLFLARSPFLTGEVLYVDGGRHMKRAVYAD